MKKKRNEHRFMSFMGKILPYAAMFLVIFGIAKIGSETKNELGADSLNMNQMAANNYNVSADQLSELYVVANLSNNFDLASTETVASNYVIVSAMKEISQTTTDRLEKPSVVDTGQGRGIRTYVVADGETMASIAAKSGLTTDQIRWSNGLKNTDVSTGQVLYLPPQGISGIVYTVKSGDTADSLASKYQSSAQEIIAINDLEVGGLAEGMRIVLPRGVLPVVERPEYVAPRRYTSTYTYSGSYANRQNMVVVARGAYNPMYNNAAGINGNPMVRGQCTWFAWYWRAANGRPLPGGATLGHARYWASRAAAMGYRVDKIPEYGAVFQTTAGYYGHVGIVTGLNADGSINVREMNLDSRGVGTLTDGTIPASAVGSFNYIH